SGNFWLNERPYENASINGFAQKAPETSDWWRWQKIAPANVDTAGINLVPTDNWPFLYLRERIIPCKPNLVGMGMIAGLSLAILLIFAPVRSIRRSGQMFFLGAGFMLLETKGVVHMALLFGSTWIVN